jgi:hypothetical protein
MFNRGVSCASVPPASLGSFEGGERPLLARDVVMEDEPAAPHFNGGIGGTFEVNLAIVGGCPLEAIGEMLRFTGMVSIHIRIRAVDIILIGGSKAGVAGEVLIGGDVLHGSNSLP